MGRESLLGANLFHSRSRVFKANFKISEKREEQIKDEHICRLIMLGEGGGTLVIFMFQYA